MRDDVLNGVRILFFLISVTGLNMSTTGKYDEEG
jgi:hypothetical protein